MANKKHLAILKRGVDEWNRWRKNSPEITPDLSHADLERMDLSRANFAEADLCDADLQESDLISVDFRKSKLRAANFGGSTVTESKFGKCDLCYARFHMAHAERTSFVEASLQAASFRACSLDGADLRKTDLFLTDFSESELADTRFDRARLDGTIFGENDLSNSRGLEAVLHGGPSFLGINSIYASRGKIPESFLRGCGVPEGFITQMQALVVAEDGIQFYSCFISYSTKDEEFTKRLHGKMRDAHLRVWFAPEDMKGGRKLHEQIETAIRIHDKLLIVLSEASLQSEWVMTELRKARRTERQSGQRKLFPVRLVDMKTLQTWECIDPDTGEDLALEVRKYHIPDFSDWKNHDAFESAFARLLQDLRADERVR